MKAIEVIETMWERNAFLRLGDDGAEIVWSDGSDFIPEDVAYAVIATDALRLSEDRYEIALPIAEDVWNELERA